MDFIKKLSLLQAFLLPGIALMIWPIFLASFFFFTSNDWLESNAINLTTNILIVVYGMFLIATVIFLAKEKKYRHIVTFIGGTVLTTLGLFFEIFIVFTLSMVDWTGM